MSGTAAEVTPVRAVDDHEIGAGPVTLELQTGLPRHVQRQAASAGATGSTCVDDRRHGSRRGVTAATRRDRALAPWLDEREEELVARRAALGAALARADDRPLRGAVRRGGRRAVRGRGVERHGRAAPALRRSPASRPGDEVITSPYSFVASANCFIYEGATPVFADIDRADAEPRSRPRSRPRSPSGRRAIVAVDIFGYPCELDELRAIAERHGLALIEDACEALGAEYKGGRSARRASTRSSRSIRTSRSRRARAGWSRRTTRRPGSCS